MATDTPAAPTTLVRHPIHVRRVEVAAVERPTPALVRLTLSGPELEGFVSLAADDHVKVLFPAPGETEPVLPTVGPRGVEWPSSGPRPLARDYTPRRYDPEAQTLEIDIVLHDGGVASTWARTAKPGDRLGVAGPRGSHVVSTSFDTYVLIADETGLPAIGRWLRELPPTATAVAIVEVRDAAERQELPSEAEVTVEWALRDLGDSLAAAVARTPLPEGNRYVWIAGEATVVPAIRRHLVDERGVDPAALSARGYWRAGVEDHQEPHED